MSPPNRAPKDTTPETGSAVKTIDLLRNLGFVEDRSLISDPMPGLSFNFRSFKLSAICGTNRHFTPVVLFTGFMVTDRTMGEVEYELPPKVESAEQGKAWITWGLDNEFGGRFQPVGAPAWLAEGRQYFDLLPWNREMAANNARPHCSVDREWARVALKTLGQHLTKVDDATPVIFGFDGKVLTITCGGGTCPLPAQGSPWREQYSIRAGALSRLPTRLRYSVEFSIWDGMLGIGNRRYKSVLTVNSTAERLETEQTTAPAETKSAAKKANHHLPAKVNIEAKAMLARVVEELRDVPGAMWRDDGDVWEEIKEQVQGELSAAWPAYIDTIKGVIDHEVTSLAPTRLSDLSGELRVPAGDCARISETLLRRLIARARKVTVGYESLDFDYFWYTLSGMTIYNKIIKRTGPHACWVLAHSKACTFGEQGEIDLDQIDRKTDIHMMEPDEFARARILNWPDGGVSDTSGASADVVSPPAMLSASEMLSRVRELGKRNAQWDAILPELNPSEDPQVHDLLIEIRGPHQFTPQVGLRVVEGGCERALAASPTADALAALREAIGRQDPFTR